MEDVTHDNLHRTAKYFMDSGRAISHEGAMDILRGFGICVQVGQEAATSRDHQVALLTLVNATRRTFLGGVYVIGAPNSPLLAPLADAATVIDAVVLLGGKPVKEAPLGLPLVLIGGVDNDLEVEPCWRLTWNGWRGGVIPARDGRRLGDSPSGGLAAALAAAVCASELFSFHAGGHPMAGRRSIGVSLWRPATDWMADDDSGPELAFLPARLWLIGLGNLGQAYLWLLACLAYPAGAVVDLVLQDHDRVAGSNESTSLLTQSAMIGRMKTRALAEWLEARGARVTLEERRFGEWLRRAPDEPGVALCGVDNSLTRATLELAKFGLVIETGLGAGPQAFRNFSMHAFPSSLDAAALWNLEPPSAPLDVLDMPAYEAPRLPHLDRCGVAQLASRSVGVPFVGLTAAAFGIAELLRRIHGGQALELVSGSVSALEDVETSPMTAPIYEFGTVPADARCAGA